MAAPIGNRNAANAKQWRDAIIRNVAKKGGSLAEGLDLAAKALVDAAIDGKEQWALRELGDRLDGKPAQAVTVGGDPENPLTVQTLALKAVDPAPDAS